MKLSRTTFTVLFAFLCASAWGTLMIPLGIDDLTHRADLIIQGTVLDQTAQRDPAGRIYTKVNVRVTEVWKGQLPTNAVGNVLTLVHSGGTVGNVREQVDGEVEYTPGEEFVAFLVLNDRGEPLTIGLSQGKFQVWRDKSGQEYVNNLFHGARKNGGNQTFRLKLLDLKTKVREVAQ